MSLGRKAGGPATKDDTASALAGKYPYPSFGTPPAMGPVFFDEFVVSDPHGSSGPFGEKQWTASTTGTLGTTAVVDGGSISGTHEFGVLRSYLTSASLTLTLHGGGAAVSASGPPVGTVFAVKFRFYTSNDCTAWFGLQDVSVTNNPAADSTDFIGVYVEPGGGNVFGMVQNNTSSSTQDLSVTPSTGSSGWVVVGWERTSTGYQFFTMDLTSASVAGRTNVGSEVTTNNPNETLRPVIGVETDASAGTRGIEVDWFSIGGRTARDE